MVIVVQEAKRWLRARRFDPSDEFVATLFKHLDTNQDGGIAKETFVEVTQIQTAKHHSPLVPSVQMAVHRNHYQPAGLL